MHWANTLDVNLFHWVNPTLSNSFLDGLMPFFSGNQFFGPAFLIACALLICKGGARGRLCVLMLVLAIALGDSVVCNTLKQAIHRPRPFHVLADVHVPAGIGRTDSGSMPSSHAANWFAATMVLFIYYRRSIWFMLPMAIIVAFSRIYNGVHYPSDVLAGAILGMGYAAAGVWTLNALWNSIGRRWFPLWWQRLPSLFNPVQQPYPVPPDARLLDQHWMRLGYVLIVVEMIANLLYLASGKIDLTGDEAYQWIWSKHLALSYYSKPPLIAIIQFLGTSIWGDTAFGVRFFSPIIAGMISLCLLRFMARIVNVRAAFWLSVAVPVVPLFAVGSVLMTIDPPSVLFWTLAMFAGWRAVRDDSTNRDWLWVGLWLGLGFLSKYHALFELLSFALFFALYAPARKQLRRPGPWLALLIVAFSSLPVVIWNHQHGWITLHHVAEGGRFDKPWAFTAANIWYGIINFMAEFLGLQTLLQNPFFFLPALWAAFAFWRRKGSDPLCLYFFSMGAPLFLVYFAISIHSRILANWVVQSIIPFFCLAAVYWNDRWQAGSRAIKYWLAIGFTFGLILVVFLHDTKLIAKATGWSLPPKWDETRRARGWWETAAVVETARDKLLLEGKPVFIIGSHYSITGELTFHLDEAKAGLPDNPLVYYQTAKTPDNQFFFWPGYLNRHGQNALYVRELDFKNPGPEPQPELLSQEFETVTDLGEFKISDNGQPVRRIQIFECRSLR